MSWFTIKSSVRYPTDLLSSPYNISWARHGYNFQSNFKHTLVCSGKEIGTLSMEWSEDSEDCNCQGMFLTIYESMEDLDSFLLREDIDLELKEKVFKACDKDICRYLADYRRITLQEYLNRILA